MALSESQKVSLALIPKVSAFLSIIGSAWIVLEVAGDKDKQKHMYHRLMGMFALVDVIVSVFFFLSTWPMHEDDPNVAWSHGNNATCQLQGFFLQAFGSSTFIYYAVLTAYFVLVIRFGVKDEILFKYEYLFHLIPLGFGLATATTAAAKGWFDNTTVWCWLIGFDQEDAVRWAFFYAPLFFCLFFVSVNMFAIYRGVHVKEKESLKYQFESHKQLVSPYMYQNTQNHLEANPDITTSTERSVAIRNTSLRSYSTRIPLLESFSDSTPNTNNPNDLEVPSNATTPLPYAPLITDPSAPLPPVGEASGPEVSSSEMAPEPVHAATTSMEEQDHKQIRFGEDTMSRSVGGESSDPPEQCSGEMGIESVDDAASVDEVERKQTMFMQSMNRLNTLRRSAAKSKRRLRRTRQVAVQATLYVVAFYLTFLPIVLDRIYQQVHDSPLYAFLVLHVTLTPLQGLFKLIIYRRQYMVRLREENPSWSWFEVLSRSLNNSSMQRLREFNSTRNLRPSSSRLQLAMSTTDAVDPVPSPANV